MSAIVDAALELYIQQRIKAAPRAEFGKAIRENLAHFDVLCKNAKLQGFSVKIINEVLVPYIGLVEDSLENKNGKI